MYLYNIQEIKNACKNQPFHQLDLIPYLHVMIQSEFSTNPDRIRKDILRQLTEDWNAECRPMVMKFYESFANKLNQRMIFAHLSHQGFQSNLDYQVNTAETQVVTHLIQPNQDPFDLVIQIRYRHLLFEMKLGDEQEGLRAFQAFQLEMKKICQHQPMERILYESAIKHIRSVYAAYQAACIQIHQEGSNFWMIR